MGAMKLVKLDVCTARHSEPGSSVSNASDVALEWQWAMCQKAMGTSPLGLRGPRRVRTAAEQLRQRGHLAAEEAEVEPGLAVGRGGGGGGVG